MQIWLKKIFCMNFYCFMCGYYVALISALVLLKCGKKSWLVNLGHQVERAVHKVRRLR